MRQEQQPTEDRIMDVLASMPTESGEPEDTSHTSPQGAGKASAVHQVSLSDVTALVHTLVAQLPTESAVPRALMICGRLLPEVRMLRLFAMGHGARGGVALAAEVTHGGAAGEGGEIVIAEAAQDITTLGMGVAADETVLGKRSVYRSEGGQALPLVAARGDLVGVLIVEMEPNAQADTVMLRLCADALAALLERLRENGRHARMERALEAIPALAVAAAEDEEEDDTGLKVSWHALEVIAELAEPSATLLLAASGDDGKLLAMASRDDDETVTLDSTLSAEIVGAVRSAPVVIVSPEENADLWNALTVSRDMLERSGGVKPRRLTLLRIEGSDGDIVAVLALAHAAEWDDDGSWLPVARVVVAVGEAALRARRLRREVATEGKARDEFISLAGHELRSPLTSIKGYAQLLARQSRKTALPRSMARSVEAIEQQSLRMAEMVGELLDASRIQRSRLELSPARMDLAQVTSKVLERRRAFHPMHTIELEVGADGLEGNWDAVRVEQIVRDLVDNAARFSPEGGLIRISMALEDGYAILRVRDQGIGVAEDEHERIFEYLYRAPEAEERNLTGLGLGLYICRHLAETMGGRLTLRETRTGDGFGSVFELALPLAP